MSKPTDIRVREVRFSFEDVKLRSPLKFGTGVIEELTYAKATLEAENQRGQTGIGYGSILLSDLWAYPSDHLSHSGRDTAMRNACRQIANMFPEATGHPLDIVMERKENYQQVADRITEELDLSDPFPLLAALVCASPVDAALHDAFGKSNGIDTYRGYGKDFWENDLSRYLGAEFEGMRPDTFLSGDYAKQLPLFQLVGGADQLTNRENHSEDHDTAHPQSLEEWIRKEGVYCFKVKLSGTDPASDVQRTAQVAKVAGKTLAEIGQNEFHLTVDANEMCPDPDTVMEYLDHLEQDHPDAYQALLYLEQPTARDLTAGRFDMKPVAERKPVLADEGITSIQDMQLARKLGWSGVALKTCKGHTAALLCAILAKKWDMIYSVQDLTNPGISLAHSVGFAGRISPVMGVEANARQFLADPARELKDLHPGFFQITNGTLDLGSLSGPGLGYKIAESYD
ncbi:MAG: enolase C-terminal domain-like protein [Candidatus Brocadiia bacterium]